MASSELQKTKRELHRIRTTLMQEKEDAEKGCRRCSRHSRCDQTTESCGNCSVFARYTEANTKLDEFQKESKKVKPVQSEDKKQAITREAYETLKNEGKRDSEIARNFGISHASLLYQKKKWFNEEQEKNEPILREKDINKSVPKVIAPKAIEKDNNSSNQVTESKQDPVAEYQKLLSILQEKITSLEKAEKASRESAKAWENQFNTVYASLAETEKKLQQFEQTCTDLKDQNKILQSKNTELFDTNKSLNDENNQLTKLMNDKVNECELHYGEMLEFQRKLDSLENEAKTQRQLSVLLAKDFIKRNEVELNA